MAALVQAFLEPWFPQRCAACDAPGRIVCDNCRRRLCPVGSFAPPPGCDSAWAAMDYDDIVRSLVLAYKYRYRHDLGRWFAACILHGNSIIAEKPTGQKSAPIDVVTWVPCARPHRMRRGYDQAHRIAAPLARALSVPCLPLLVRTDRGSQSRRSRPERLRGPRLISTRALNGERVALVDDVTTTGASLAHAATALRSAGAGQVHALAVARSSEHAHG